MSDISLFFHATLSTLFIPLRFRRVFGNPVTLSASTSTPALNKYSAAADGAGADDGSKLKKSFSRFSFLLASDATKEEQEEEKAAGPKSLGAVE